MTVGADVIAMPRGEPPPPGTQGHFFEVHVYNAMVRALVGSREHHGELPDGWAEIQRCEVSAANAAQARLRATQLFPAEEGYVITGVVARN